MQKKYTTKIKKTFPPSLGFTLIEVLVVVSIMSLISSIIMASFHNAQKRSRDGKRIADISNMQKALELYYLQNNSYPKCWDPGYPGGCDLVDFGEPGTRLDSSLDGTFMGFLKTSNLIANEPKDPKNTLNPAYFYMYSTEGEFPPGSGHMYFYVLGVPLEDLTNPALKSSITVGNPLYGGIYAVGSIK